MTLRCLIVDDSDDFLGSATRLLESQGVDVVGSAKTAEQALRLAETLAPDVALVDVELGEEDGIELARELEARLPGLRAILISAHDYEDLDELISAGPVVGYLAKRDLRAGAIEDLLASEPGGT
jgi:two-component system, NarL family, nitrate/nitrite response regulator NarL